MKEHRRAIILMKKDAAERISPLRRQARDKRRCPPASRFDMVLIGVVHATVPFDKKCKRHGIKSSVKVECYRAFWEKGEKARYKKMANWRKLPCLLAKSVKGTV